MGLKFKSKEDELDYHFDCVDHDGDANELYRVKVSAQAPNVFKDDGECTSDALRRETSGRNKGEWRPRYVLWEGHYYHIARFLPLQVGKTYTPAASRQERWKSTNSTSFFERLGCMHDGLKLGSFIVYQINKKDCAVGCIVRIAQRFGPKAIHPTLSLEKEKSLEKVIFTCKRITFKDQKAFISEPLIKNMVMVKGEAFLAEADISIDSKLNRKTKTLLKKYKIKF